MPKLDTYSESTHPSVIIFGLPKSGKTELAGKLAEHFNLLWFDLEDGFETLLKMPKEWQHRVELIKLPDTPTYPIAIETCLKVVKVAVSICIEHGKCGCAICKRNEVTECKTVEQDQHDLVHLKYFTDVDLYNLPEDTIVVFDSSTQLTSSAVANIARKMPDDYKFEWDDWYSLSTLMDKFFSHIQNLPCKRVVISHVTEAELATGKKMLVPVAGSKNFSSNVAKYFGHVIYTEVKNKAHRVASATNYANNILTGSRTDVRLEDSPEATLLSIFKPEAVPEEQVAKVVEKPKPTSSSAKAGTQSTNAKLEAVRAAINERKAAAKKS